MNPLADSRLRKPWRSIYDVRWSSSATKHIRGGGVTTATSKESQPSEPAEPVAGSRVSRLQRRKEKTRQALIDAARAMLAAGTATRASIQEIAEAADVGFGSFYNHFTDKQELFDTAVSGVLAEWGHLIDAANAGIDDPAARFAVALRTSGRLGLTHREIGAVIVRSGFSVLDDPAGLAPRSMRDLQAAVDAGRFNVGNVTVAFTAVAGAVLGLTHLWLRGDQAIGEESVDETTEQLLRMFGLSDSEAHQLAHAPLPARHLELTAGDDDASS